MVSTPPKLVWTRTPTVYPPSWGGRRREEVPMPPLKPSATVPVPGADRALLDWPALGGLDGGKHVFTGDVPSAGVAEVAIVGFAYQRVDGLDILVS